MQFKANDPSAELTAVIHSAEKAMAHAATQAMRVVVEQGAKAVKADLAANGFGSEWQDTILTRIFPQAGDSLKPTGQIYSSTAPYLAVFENGATIRGKPTLWLPIEANLPANFQRGGPAVSKINPKRYNAIVGRLVLVAHPGKRPLLYDPARKKFVFVGVPSVTVGQHLHVHRAVEQAVAQIDKAYDVNFKVD